MNKNTDQLTENDQQLKLNPGRRIYLFGRTAGKSNAMKLLIENFKLETMRKNLVLGLVLLMWSCKNDSQPTTQEGDFKIEFLFEQDGCKMYRFKDGGEYTYWPNCLGSTEYTSEDNGKPLSDDLQAITSEYYNQGSSGQREVRVVLDITVTGGGTDSDLTHYISFLVDGDGGAVGYENAFANKSSSFFAHGISTKRK